MYSSNMLRAMMLLVTIGILSVAAPAGAYLQVYGGPADGLSPHVGDGVAVANVRQYDSGGTHVGDSTVRWDAAGSPGVVLESLGGSTTAQAMNIHGTVAGTIDNIPAHLFVQWSASGAANPLSSTADMISATPHDINSQGVIVGGMTKTNDLGTWAIRWENGGQTAVVLDPLQTSPSGRAYANARVVNNNGTAAGISYVWNDQGQQLGYGGVRWDAGSVTPTPLDALDQYMGYFLSDPYAINDSNVIVGRCLMLSDTGQWQNFVPARWDAQGHVTRLPSLPGDPEGEFSGEAVAVNSTGVTIGFINYDTHDGDRAVRWNAAGTAVTELGHFGIRGPDDPYISSYAYDINADGLIVGKVERYLWSSMMTGYRAVVWGTDGMPIDLNTLIDPTSGWLLTSALEITDNGWIVGRGMFDPDGPGGVEAYARPWLMQIPEPASWSLVILALAGWIIPRRSATR
ncbi:MAG: DUF3466 family protein [Phycisphaeraceae bacterium]|nr:DUF3466 family protein [Phycisphaeraceae bacterium]